MARTDKATDADLPELAQPELAQPETGPSKADEIAALKARLAELEPAPEPLPEHYELAIPTTGPGIPVQVVLRQHGTALRLPGPGYGLTIESGGPVRIGGVEQQRGASLRIRSSVVTVCGEHDGQPAVVTAHRRE